MCFSFVRLSSFHTSRCSVMRVEPCRERGNRKSRCVRICGAHVKTLVQSSFHPFAQTS
jgi:hypothetical protein